jgi:hypothetical protein
MKETASSAEELVKNVIGPMIEGFVETGLEFEE